MWALVGFSSSLKLWQSLRATGSSSTQGLPVLAGWFWKYPGPQDLTIGVTIIWGKVETRPQALTSLLNSSQKALLGVLGRQISPQLHALCLLAGGRA